MHFPGLVPLTQAQEHSDTLLHTLLVCIFLNARFPKYFSCHCNILFYTISHCPQTDWSTLSPSWDFAYKYSQRKENELTWCFCCFDGTPSLSFREKKKERKLLKLNTEYQISTLTIVSGGKCIEILVHNSSHQIMRLPE